MELAVSSSGHFVDYLISRNYDHLFDVLIESSKACMDFSEGNKLKSCELVLEPPEVINQSNKEKFIEVCSSYSIKKQLHGPFLDMSLCSSNPWIAKSSIESYVESAKICHEIEAEIMVVHPGRSGLRTQAKKRLVTNVIELLDAVSDYGVKICLENMPKHESILLDENEFEYFSSKVNRNDLFFTFDTSHFWTNSGDVNQFWNKFHKKIKNVHIAENADKNSDRHPDLGTGKVDFPNILEVLKKFEYEGSLVIELNSAKNLQKSVEYLRDLL